MNAKLAIDYDYLKPSVAFVVNYSRLEHRAVAESRVKWLGDLRLDFILAEDELAEIKAAKECLDKPRCIVLSRDHDSSTIELRIFHVRVCMADGWLLPKSVLLQVTMLEYVDTK